MKLHPDNFRTREDYWLSVRHVIEKHESLEMFVRENVSEIKVENGELFLLYGSTKSKEKKFWMKVDTHDIRSAAMTALCYGGYEPMVEKVFARAITNATFFLDVGANSGFYTLLARVTSPQTKVVAIEPNPRVANILFDNLIVNDESSLVTILNYAVFDSRGSERLTVPNFSGSAAGSIRNLHPDEEVESTFEIRTVPIDDLTTNFSQLDLLKMDIEGAEFQALQGARQTLIKFQPIIIVELLRKWMTYFNSSPTMTLDYLVSLGYKCFAIDSTGLLPVDILNDQVKATNFLFLNSKHSIEEYSDLLAVQPS
jgi:FkbM family methyltransferase